MGKRMCILFVYENVICCVIRILYSLVIRFVLHELVLMDDVRLTLDSSLNLNGIIPVAILVLLDNHDRLNYPGDWRRQRTIVALLFDQLFDRRLRLRRYSFLCVEFSNFLDFLFALLERLRLDLFLIELVSPIKTQTKANSDTNKEKSRSEEHTSKL